MSSRLCGPHHFIGCSSANASGLEPDQSLEKDGQPGLDGKRIQGNLAAFYPGDDPFNSAGLGLDPLLPRCLKADRRAPMSALMEPSYLRLWETGAFIDRVKKIRDLLTPCRLCPRNCRVDRLAGQTGFCGQGGRARVAKALPHFGRGAAADRHPGAGTVFFTGCALRCLYCQKFQISQEGLGGKYPLRSSRTCFWTCSTGAATTWIWCPPPPTGQPSWRPWSWPFPGGCGCRSSIIPTAMSPRNCCSVWKGSWTSTCRT